MITEPDRRRRKTRKLILNAFFKLMQTTPYRKIRISRIAEEADISRSTFYQHFEGKDALLLSVADEIIESYFLAIDEVLLGSEKNPTRLLFSKWQENLDRMQLILDAGMEFRIYQRLRMFNAQRSVTDNTCNLLLDDYIRTMLDGACFALLLRWTQDRASILVDQMERLFAALQVDALFENLGQAMPDFGA